MHVQHIYNVIIGDAGVARTWTEGGRTGVGELDSDQDLHADGHCVGDLLEDNDAVPRELQPVGAQVLVHAPRHHIHNMARSAQPNRNLHSIIDISSSATPLLKVGSHPQTHRCVMKVLVQNSLNFWLLRKCVPKCKQNPEIFSVLCSS